MNSSVTEVLNERASVCTSAAFTFCASGAVGASETFSRMRSKTTIESWTEKPITVSRPVTNIRLISMPKSFPKSENAPSTITVSWSSATIAQVAYRNGLGTEENAKAM